MALPFQLMEHGESVELTPKNFNSVDVENGSQSFSLEVQSCPLEFDGSKMHAEISKPTQEDYDTFPTCEMIILIPSILRKIAYQTLGS